MKERDVARKRMLRKKRDMRVIRKTLKEDIANFMTEHHLKTASRPDEELSRVLSDGFKGYHRMKTKDLKQQFERIYTLIRSDVLINYYYDAYNVKLDRFNNTDNKAVRVRMLEKSDGLMTRLIELSFDLDIED